MKKWNFVPSLFFLILGGALFSNHLKAVRATACVNLKTLILYDATSGEIPNTSLMTFTDFPPGSASLTYTNGVTDLDTTNSGKDTFAGWVSSQATTQGFPILDQTAGIQVNFTLQIESETHANNNRAGFSVILLDQDAKGIELSFWENEVWVQGDENSGGLFRHGEGTAFVTTSMTDYQLTIAGDTYNLSANSEPLLTGPVRDYGNFSGFPDPYETPNFLFMGDDTTSSQSRVKLWFVSVTGIEPVTPTAGVTSTSTTIPLNTSSPTPLPSATSTPFPTPIPSHPMIDICPAGWIFGSMLIVSVLLIKRTKDRTMHI